MATAKMIQLKRHISYRYDLTRHVHDIFFAPIGHTLRLFLECGPERLIRGQPYPNKEHAM